MENSLREHSAIHWDIIVIGGGATGTGIAFDAASRGFKTLLLEQADFGKGTSSRSTKLLHGGFRYLAQGDIILVIEALQERGILFKNAPHLTTDQEFIIPVYTWWDVIKYTIGLTFYDILAGKLSLGKSRYITPHATREKLPMLNHQGLKGGIIYHDGRFDDCRFLISLVRSLADHGGTALNYTKVTALLKDGSGKVDGVKVRDMENNHTYELHAGLVINATGIFVDDVLKMDHDVTKRTLRPSQGVHLVFDNSFLNSSSAIMIPKTDDGRVLFAIPWYDKVVVGTTDTPGDKITLEPKARDEEINFILETAGKYLARRPERKDILCVYAGLRPLSASPGNPSHTRELSRRHKVTLTSSGLVTVEGGKWTIYRRMARDTLNKAMRAGLLENRPCMTHQMPLHGFTLDGRNDRLFIYGSHAGEIRNIMEKQPGWARILHSRLPYTEAEIRWICRNEMPRKLEDLLARRTRALILDAVASLEMARDAAVIMADELGRDEKWIVDETEEYSKLVQNYLG